MAERKRHWFLNVWMHLLLIISFSYALGYLILSFAVYSGFDIIPVANYSILLVFSWINLISIIAIFHWKKWGFWGFLGSSVVIFLFSFSDETLFSHGLIGPIDALILFGLLHIGKENKAWPQLN